MRYDLFSLQLFLAAVANKSIAKAADAQNIAASAVSKRISDLEHMIGAQLFYRQQRGVELTPAGEEFNRYVSSIMRLIERMDADMSEFSEGLRGHIRVAANTSSITQFLPEDLAEFTTAHPDLRIKLAELTSDEIIAAVREGLVDIGIYSGMVQVEDLDITPYRTDTLVVIAPQGHPICKMKTAKFKDLFEYNLVGLQQGSSLQAYLDKTADTSQRTLRNCVEVMSFDGVRRMVQAGLGIAVLPYGAAEPYLESTELSLIPLDEPWATRTLNLAVRDEKAITRSTQALIDHLLGNKG